jgi:type IV pilus assembly protein PilW
MEIQTMSRTQNFRQSGLSLIELMIAMALGLIIMIGVGSLFVSSSRSNAELQKSAQQIENGRYATQILSDDLKHVGYFGEYAAAVAPAGTPDPCETNNATNLYNGMALPVQAYRAPDFATRPVIAGTTCGALISNANLAPGSDVIVLRRASTAPLADGETAVSGEAYLQANGLAAEMQFGNGAAFTSTAKRKADGTATTILDKTALRAAPTRKYEVRVYFVAPCSQGSGADGICAVGDDTIPTLKRLELKAVGGAREMSIVPLVEGIEFLKAEWGIDDQPVAVSASTGLTGDGVVESYQDAPSDAELTNAVAAKIFVLARNTEPTSNHVDDKTYTLGTVAGTTTVATNDRFKRHVFGTDARMMNLGGRKEIPE